MTSENTGAKWGFRLCAVLGLAFLALGAAYLTEPHSPAPVRLMAIVHMFGLRTMFLGALALILSVLGERRALFVLMSLATLLPLADMIVSLPALNGDWTRAAIANLPFEAPLILGAALLGAGR
jgi:hypothetical protein